MKNKIQARLELPLKRQIALVQELCDEYEPHRNRLVVDNPDWQRISLALASLGDCIDRAIVLIDPSLYAATWPVIRQVIEVVYVMGYQRGQLSATMPSFTVAQSLAEAEGKNKP